mgnify:CR=1 FL=1
MHILLKRTPKERVESSSLMGSKPSLLLEGDVVDDEEEPLHVADGAAGEDVENYDLAVDQQQIQNGHHLVPAVEVALEFCVIIPVFCDSAVGLFWLDDFILILLCLFRQRIQYFIYHGILTVAIWQINLEIFSLDHYVSVQIEEEYERNEHTKHEQRQLESFHFGLQMLMFYAY